MNEDKEKRIVSSKRKLELSEEKKDTSCKRKLEVSEENKCVKRLKQNEAHLEENVKLEKEYIYCVWKKKKKERGEWLPWKEYQLQKDVKKKQELEKELEEINKRLYPKSHEELRKEFEIYLSTNENKVEVKKESITLKRDVILDTETTGLSNTDKIVEISILELVEGVKTGRKFHSFINPCVKVSKKAVEIHKLTNEKLSKFPKFNKIAEDIIKFIGDANIVAHNSNFDRRMLNNELRECGWEEYPKKRFIDTLEIARFLFPGEKHNQDALCRKFNIDNFNRLNTGIHSAMEDTVMLYFIYNKMTELLEEKNMSPYDFKENQIVDLE